MTNKRMVQTPFGVFSTKTAIKDYIRVWLYEFEPGDRIEDSDIVAGLVFLIRQRKSKIAKIGDRQIVGWTIEPNNTGSRCFAAILDDGVQLHFSFPKAVDRLFESASENA